jgi:hypothetical protein
MYIKKDRRARRGARSRVYNTRTLFVLWPKTYRSSPREIRDRPFQDSPLPLYRVPMKKRDELPSAAPLRAAIVAVTADGASLPNLDFARFDWARHFQRDYWTMFGIARELDCSIDDLLRDEGRGFGQIERLERDMEIDAAHTIMERLRDLLPPVRAILLERARRRTWRQILKTRPERPPWSVMDDYRHGMRHLWHHAGPEMNLMVTTRIFHRLAESSFRSSSNRLKVAIPGGVRL